MLPRGVYRRGWIAATVLAPMPASVWVIIFHYRWILFNHLENIYQHMRLLGSTFKVNRWLLYVCCKITFKSLFALASDVTISYCRKEKLNYFLLFNSLTWKSAIVRLSAKYTKNNSELCLLMQALTEGSQNSFKFCTSKEFSFMH